MMQDVRDVLAAVAGDAGFETFEETDEGLNGYVQQTLFDQTALDEALEAFPFEEASITYEVAEAEDQDWNAEWEAEGFEPIVVADGQLVVHDGRHLPATSHQSPVTIEIDARMAFGTGTHETTRLMLTTLLSLAPHFSSILDCGTGTGILAIAALKLGAMYQKSVVNNMFGSIKQMFKINNVNNMVLEKPLQRYDNFRINNDLLWI